MTTTGPHTVDASAFEVARYVRPGDVVAWGQGGAEPCTLTEALVAQRASVGGRFTALFGATWSDTLAPEHADTIDFVSYCGTGANRRLADAGVLDVLPVHYSQFARALDTSPNRVDVLFLQLAPTDQSGCYSLSVAYEYLVPLLRSARLVIAEVNAAAPCTYGTHVVRESDLDVIVLTRRAPLEVSRAPASETELRVARHAASLIDDGMTIQCGIGALPEAILAQLADRRDLGVHSGTIGDAVADLSERGAVTNARKRDDRGITVAGTMMGTSRIYTFAHRNRAVQFRSTAYTHDVEVLGRVNRFAAINSAIEVDLTGQINAETVSGRYVGAVGGSVDFLRGAARSHGGLPLVALPSRARGASRVIAWLSGPASTPRADAGVIVTEYGIADLRGLTLRQRVRKMLDIAAPEMRATLEDEAGRAGLTF
jgi:acetyl-CoA hydrolase